VRSSCLLDGSGSQGSTEGHIGIVKDAITVDVNRFDVGDVIGLDVNVCSDASRHAACGDAPAGIGKLAKHLVIGAVGERSVDLDHANVNLNVFHIGLIEGREPKDIIFRQECRVWCLTTEGRSWTC